MYENNTGISHRIFELISVKQAAGFTKNFLMNFNFNGYFVLLFVKRANKSFVNIKQKQDLFKQRAQTTTSTH